MDRITFKLGVYNVREIEYNNLKPWETRYESRPFQLKDGFFDDIYVDKDVSREDFIFALRTILTFMKQTKDMEYIIDLDTFGNSVKYEKAFSSEGEENERN